VSVRRAAALGALAAALAVASTGSQAGAQAQPPAAYTVVTPAGRQTLPVRLLGGQEMVALDDLARLAGLTVREEVAAGGITIAKGDQTVVLTAGQTLASVGGRLVSLSAPPVHEGRAWFVPLDFISRALAPIAGQRVDLRQASRLLVLGEVRIPRVAVRMEPLGTGARITADITPAAPHTVRQDGPRLTIRFEADALDATIPATTTAPDLVRAVRLGDSPNTIVIETGPRFASYRATDAPGPGGSARLVLDLAAQPTTEAGAPGAPATPPGTAPPAPVQPPVLELPPAGGLRTVVVDAGHGGDDGGAKGAAGTLEKSVTLAVARKLKAALEGRLGVRVIMTREGDRTVGPDERASMANNNKADLFVSLHASASPRTTLSGAEVFYLALDAYGEAADRAAHTAPAVLPVFGGGAREIDVIPWELAQARYIEESAALARAAEAALRGRVPMAPRPLQQAPFRVLVGANMPAILVEMGYLTNPDQEKALGADAYQTSLAGALVDAIVTFRDGIPAAPAAPPSAAPAGRP
jgi:N-acetylmuramoyl-L-alanine amidase